MQRTLMQFLRLPERLGLRFLMTTLLKSSLRLSWKAWLVVGAICKAGVGMAVAKKTAERRLIAL
ncbi:putative SAP domain protein [Synechococcus sp. BIOS-E4-1]|nr:putative SAP domain protein [Synechococcus sp. BIOS-E4-1]